ncbi:MAG: acyl carrier protein [Proteobacteria bacterium]|nr:acyl carrier protein [Pseudomonadota bacterium]MBU1585697.1 acyl carrier protein [Pseudomonadota bacterium]MBU2452140.1 acyl carrier protein [Pseudomonadota bacterium]MBU2629210.1 acyl carrier protein [Pseudomonadota bacterium]
MEKLKRTIIKIIGKELDVPPRSIKDDTSIQEDLGADSLDVINIVMAIENKFNIEIDQDMIMEFNTVNNIVRALAIAIEPERR